MRRKWVLGFISAAFLMGMIISVAFTYQLGFFEEPNARCTQPIETAMLQCTNEDFQEGRKKMWWYYDSLSRACRLWEQVCLENTLRPACGSAPPPASDSLLYGPERLGHQTQLMREHINKVTTVLCVAIGLVLLIFFLATVALLVAALGTGPKRHRSVETTTESEATTPPHRNKSGKMSHPRAMIEVTPFDAAVRESRCDAPRLVHCSSNLTTLVRDHGWFYMPGAGNPGGCVEWLPAHLCVVQKGFREGGGYRFSTREECSTLCERGTPRRECVQPLPLTAVYNCTHAAVQDQQHWWFYDIVSHACREWEHACVYKSYATMAHCVRDCLPEPRQSS
ncbi:hypothetical protein MTO96_049303 [Rhipicephalus appendiculatus]